MREGPGRRGRPGSAGRRLPRGGPAVVAFLQNQWLSDPERAAEMIERTPAVRPRLIKYALFQSFTGRRLVEAFGEGCREWVWDNASPRIAGRPSGCFPADPEHIRAVLERHDPDVVLAFGRVASEALRGLCDCELVAGPHPAARAADVPDRLRGMARRLERLVSLYNGVSE